MLPWGSVAGEHKGLRYEREGKKKKKGGRRPNIRLYQTPTLNLPVIQTPSTNRASVFFTHSRHSHTFSCQIVFAPRFTKWSSCQILQSWLPIKQERAWSFKMHTVLIHFGMTLHNCHMSIHQNDCQNIVLWNNNLQDWLIIWKLKFPDKQALSARMN